MDCNLTTFQVWAGYLTWLGLVKLLGAVILSAGVITLFWGVLTRIVFRARVLLEIIGYAVSAALIAGGYWTPSDYLVWVVLAGCLLFAASVFATLWIHHIKGDDPKSLATLFMLVWGTVAIYYGMPEVGFLAVAALMSLLGFSVVVSPLSYAFGFKEKAAIPSATMAAILLAAVFLLLRLSLPVRPGFVEVFMPGTFWIGSFVAMTGLLIMSSRYYADDFYQLVLAQVLFIGVAAIGFMLGLIVGIAPLTGIAGTFFVLYLAEKPLDITPHNAISVGISLILVGGVLWTAWEVAKAHEDVVRHYLTTAL